MNTPAPAYQPERCIEKPDIFDPQAYIEAGRRARAARQVVVTHTMLRCTEYLGAEVDRDELAATCLTDTQLLGRGRALSAQQAGRRPADREFR